jgi:MOSC domain-containing protein YiiM
MSARGTMIDAEANVVSKPAQVISVNVGLPRKIEWRGETVETSIYKSPLSGRARVRRLNLDGDRQADLTVHGGPAKAVYAYPSEHYALWREELEDAELSWGAFGENLTTTGMAEGDVRIGDRLRIGTAEFVVTQPRTPCFKLIIRFGRADMLKRLLQSGRTGFYLSVMQEGDVGAGDEIATVARDPQNVTVADISNLYRSGGDDQALLRRVSQLSALPVEWREYFAQRVR